ncbi:MAG: hypothetical protein AAF653_11110 [Chloroflexota bacterium]
MGYGIGIHPDTIRRFLHQFHRGFVTQNPLLKLSIVAHLPHQRDRARSMYRIIREHVEMQLQQTRTLYGHQLDETLTTLEVLEADFSTGIRKLQALSVLYHRLIRDDAIHPDEMVQVIHRSAVTFNRYVQAGLQILADDLIHLEVMSAATVEEPPLIYPN